ncbi:response regulator transcription factor [Duganella dendranthematis]|uniref:Response regulator transcription factor n=1 Tax=Duganella dendranthematis TaxID=2728021 RepID=A0ABX6M5V4_9BURK|nr:response regulator transcription factor [Duganella dendranthematis]QJD89651.1 response regulator transcription factor [Duganella dendranthematis]
MTTTTATPIRIMLVDDHKTMLWGLEKLIEGAGAALRLVGTAHNNDSALREASRLRPDLIVLDLDLEGRSSLEVLPQLLQDSGARVLILSGNRDQSLLAQAVKLGARGVLSKEAPADQVIKAIERVHAGEMHLDASLMGALLAQPAPVKADPEAARIATLTPKERKIVAIVVESNGAANKELAAKLFIAEPTLRNNLTSIYQKLGVANRLELYVYATRHGLQ